MLNETFRQRCAEVTPEGMRRLEINNKIEALRPVEIVGNHWINREIEDSDAGFYRREEVDEILKLVKSACVLQP